jgi:hypothetical protein
MLCIGMVNVNLKNSNLLIRLISLNFIERFKLDLIAKKIIHPPSDFLPDPRNDRKSTAKRFEEFRIYCSGLC